MKLHRILSQGGFPECHSFLLQNPDHRLVVARSETDKVVEFLAAHNNPQTAPQQQQKDKPTDVKRDGKIVCCIRGPPGAGKSWLLAAAVDQYLQRYPQAAPPVFIDLVTVQDLHLDEGQARLLDGVNKATGRSFKTMEEAREHFKQTHTPLFLDNVRSSRVLEEFECGVPIVCTIRLSFSPETCETIKLEGFSKEQIQSLLAQKGVRLQPGQLETVAEALNLPIVWRFLLQQEGEDLYEEIKSLAESSLAPERLSRWVEKRLSHLSTQAQAMFKWMWAISDPSQSKAAAFPRTPEQLATFFSQAAGTELNPEDIKGKLKELAGAQLLEFEWQQSGVRISVHQLIAQVSRSLPQDRERVNAATLELFSTTPLMQANIAASLGVTKYFEEGHELGRQDLEIAILYDRLDFIKSLTHKVPESERGKLLGVACQLRKEEIALLLLENTDNEGIASALGDAALSGLIDVMKEMVKKLEQGKATFDMNIADAKGRTPLHLAAREGHKEVVAYLASHPQCHDINMADANGDTPLHYAAIEGHKEVVEYLASHPQCHNINMADAEGATPLHYAAFQGHKEVVEYLASHPQCHNINIADAKGRTPLYVAVMNGNKEVVACLASHPKCDINMADANGRTPLHVAVYQEYKEVVECLASHPQCNINMANANRIAALHVAAIQGHKEVVEYLASHPQCDINMADAKGTTPLHYAAFQGHKEVVECLASHPQCDINIADQHGRTALDYATMNGHKEVVEYLASHPGSKQAVHDWANRGSRATLTE